MYVRMHETIFESIFYLRTHGLI